MDAHNLMICGLAVFATAGCLMEPVGYPGGPAYVNGPGHAPGYNHPPQRWESNGMQKPETYRQAGVKHGSSDRARGLSHDPSRYQATVPWQARRAFAQGYSEGYGEMANAQSDKYYQGGSVTGASDFQKGLSYDPSRYAATVPAQFRREFSAGYANGWSSAGGR